MLNVVVKNFLRGLIVTVPFAVTAYVVYAVVKTLDGWIDLERWVGRPLPGGGLVLTLVLITFVGFMASNFATRWMFGAIDDLFGRLPLVKLIYTSIRDVTGAFVGEKRRFDRPVLVSLGEGIDTLVVGFQTRDDLSELGLADHVAVYLPQSYNFAGNLLAVPRDRVRPLTAESTVVLALVVSGGVSGESKPPGGDAARLPRGR
jgi:uncharacterized membrane protein